MSDEYRVGDDPIKDGAVADGVDIESLPGFRGHVVPWPGTVDLEGIQSSELSPEQDARATALYHARATLERRGGPLTGPGTSAPPSVDQIIRLANWIITGRAFL